MIYETDTVFVKRSDRLGKPAWYLVIGFRSKAMEDGDTVSKYNTLRWDEFNDAREEWSPADPMERFVSETGVTVIEPDDTLPVDAPTGLRRVRR